MDWSGISNPIACIVIGVFIAGLFVLLSVLPILNPRDDKNKDEEQ